MECTKLVWMLNLQLWIIWFTLQSLQYITSIIEAGNDSSEAQDEAYDEGWRREGLQRGRVGQETSREVRGNEEEGGYDTLRFSSDARAKERHLAQRGQLLTNIQVRQTTCPASQAGRLRASALCRRQHRTLRSSHTLPTHPEPHLNTDCLWPFLSFHLNSHHQHLWDQR